MAFQPGDHIYARASADRRADEALRIQQQQEQRAQQTDSRDAQMDDVKLRNAKIEQAVQYLGMATPENWQNFRQQAIQSGLGDETTLPMEYDDNWIKSTRAAFASASSSIPSAIQEYQFYKNLPADEQSVFMDVKRNPQYLNLGDRFERPNSAPSLPVGIPPKDTPEAEAARAKAIRDAENKSDAELKPKTKPTAAFKQELDAMEKLDVAENLQEMLGNFRTQIAQGKLKFGALEGLGDRARNFAGMSDEESRNSASFRSSLEKLRNDSLRLNNGVQTEGDSQRAWNELVTNLNDPLLVDQRLAEIIELNKKAAQLQQEKIDAVNAEYGDGSKRPSLNDSPRGNTERSIAGKKYSPSRNQTKIIYSDGTEEVVDGRQ